MVESLKEFLYEISGGAPDSIPEEIFVEMTRMIARKFSYRNLIFFFGEPVKWSLEG